MVPEIWDMTGRTFCHFATSFAFHPPNNPENQNFVKKKNTPGNINLHVCHK